MAEIKRAIPDPNKYSRVIYLEYEEGGLIIFGSVFLSVLNGWFRSTGMGGGVLKLRGDGQSINLSPLEAQKLREKLKGCV